MILNRLLGRAHHLLLFGGCLAALLGGVVLTMTLTINGLLYADIEKTSSELAAHFINDVPDLRQITAGAQPSAETKSQFVDFVSRGGVFRFKIFTPAGKLRVTSDGLAAISTSSGDLGEHNAIAKEVTRTGNVHIEIEEGTPPNRPTRYAEAYLPLVIDGQTVAILETYVDQTAEYGVFRNYFLAATSSLAVLIGMAFAFPAWGFYRRNLQKIAADEQVRFLAHHDWLTRLPNRAWFLENLRNALANTERDGNSVALHYLDLDHFKQVNDKLGHATGDLLLGAFAERLRSVVRPNEMIARLGGDEFAIAQLSISDRTEAEALAKRVLQVLAAPFVMGDHEIAVTSSIGIAISPADGRNPEHLIHSADLALYAAKGQGRERYCFFEETMNAELDRRSRLERLLRETTANESFKLYFQPLQDGTKHRICGFEALLRLPQADGTLIPPDQFIPLAEETGLITTIGTWVIKQACKVAATWPAHLTIAVNLSPKQFKDGRLVEVVREALAASGLAAERLELEITEGLLLADTENTLQQLAALKTLGVAIVMDDFGTGYSSLSYLWKFPFNKIKVDKSFMGAFAGEHEIGSIMRTIIALGRAMDITITAEGVETEAQASFLYDIACDQLQGFHLGRPVPEVDVAGTILRDLERSVSVETHSNLGHSTTFEAQIDAVHPTAVPSRSQAEQS